MYRENIEICVLSACYARSCLCLFMLTPTYAYVNAYAYICLNVLSFRHGYASAAYAFGCARLAIAISRSSRSQVLIEFTTRIRASIVT